MRSTRDDRRHDNMFVGTGASVSGEQAAVFGLDGTSGAKAETALVEAAPQAPSHIMQIVHSWDPAYDLRLMTEMRQGLDFTDIPAGWGRYLITEDGRPVGFQRWQWIWWKDEGGTRFARRLNDYMHAPDGGFIDPSGELVEKFILSHKRRREFYGMTPEARQNFRNEWRNRTEAAAKTARQEEERAEAGDEGDTLHGIRGKALGLSMAIVKGEAPKRREKILFHGPNSTREVIPADA